MVVPIVEWITGEKAWLVSKKEENGPNGIEMIKCGLILFARTKKKHNISDDRLDFTYYPEGVLYRSYPKRNFLPLSDDQEDPTILIWNKFDGTMTTPTGELFFVKSIIDDNEKLDNDNKKLRARIASLEEENLTLAAQYAKWKARYGTTLVGDSSKDAGELLGKAIKVMKGGSPS